MMSDADYGAWLRSLKARRVLLVEADYHGGTEYGANAPYISKPTDAIPNRPYHDWLAGAIEVEIRLDGAFTLGEISVKNTGALDAWLTRAWRGHELRLFLGGKGWSRDDFRLIVRAVNAGISGAEAGFLRFGIYDSKALLDAPMPRTLLPDSTPAPLAFGAPFNCRPALLDDFTHEYQVHDGALTSVVVRVNGAVVTATPNLSAGTYTLAARPLGNLGTDPVTDTNTAAELIEQVADAYGIDVDEAALAALPDFGLGLYYDETQISGAAILEQVAASIGAFWGRDALGALTMAVLEAPDETATLAIGPDDIVPGTLRLVETEEPAKQITLRYAKNFAPVSRDSLATILDATPAFAERLTQEWVQVVTTNELTGHPLAPVMEYETYLVSPTDAQAECDRRAALREVQRERWELTCFLAPAQIRIGQTVQITSLKLGWSAGRLARVIVAEPSLTIGRVALEVWL